MPAGKLWEKNMKFFFTSLNLWKKESDPVLDQDPLVWSKDPRIRIRIKISRTHNTDADNCSVFLPRQVIMGSCEKRINRLEAGGGGGPPPAPPPPSSIKEEGVRDSLKDETGGGTTSTPTLTPVRPQQEARPARRSIGGASKARAEATLGKLHNSLRHIQAFIGQWYNVQPVYNKHILFLPLSVGASI